MFYIIVEETLWNQRCLPQKARPKSEDKLYKLDILTFFVLHTLLKGLAGISDWVNCVAIFFLLTLNGVHAIEILILVLSTL